MKKTIVSVLALVFAPVATFAFINASSVQLPTSVLPGAQVDAEVHVQLTNGDDWHSTRIEVSIPGPNNDIDQCFNTADADSNGTHVRHVFFNAPNAVGSYPLTATAYENGSCTGSNNDATATLVVAVPPPPPPVCPEGTTGVFPVCVPIVVPPTDVCPNIDGVQETVPEGMQLVEGQCITPEPDTDLCPEEGLQTELPCAEVVPPVEETPVANDSHGGGIGISIGIYCDDPMVVWMAPGGKCWDPSTRTPPAAHDVGTPHQPIYMYWWDEVLKKMLSTVL